MNAMIEVLHAVDGFAVVAESVAAHVGSHVNGLPVGRNERRTVAVGRMEVLGHVALRGLAVGIEGYTIQRAVLEAGHEKGVAPAGDRALSA